MTPQTEIGENKKQKNIKHSSSIEVLIFSNHSFHRLLTASHVASHAQCKREAHVVRRHLLTLCLHLPWPREAVNTSDVLDMKQGHEADTKATQDIKGSNMAISHLMNKKHASACASTC